MLLNREMSQRRVNLQLWSVRFSEPIPEMAVYGLVKMKTDRGGNLQDEVACFYGRMKEK